MSDVLLKIYRGNLVENIYRGDIAIVHKAGNHTLSFGDKEKITYWRSAAKPIQVMPVIYSGAADKYKLTDKEITIMASSHNGEEKHIKLVYKILDKINLDEKDLLCGVHLPFLYQLKILAKEKLNQLKKYCSLWMKNYRNEKVGKFISDFKLREI